MRSILVSYSSQISSSLYLHSRSAFSILTLISSSFDSSLLSLLYNFPDRANSDSSFYLIYSFSSLIIKLSLSFSMLSLLMSWLSYSTFPSAKECICFSKKICSSRDMLASFSFFSISFSFLTSSSRSFIFDVAVFCYVLIVFVKFYVSSLKVFISDSSFAIFLFDWALRVLFYSSFSAIFLSLSLTFSFYLSSSSFKSDIALCPLIFSRCISLEDYLYSEMTFYLLKSSSFFSAC